MRILFYFLFFIFVQILASQYALARPSQFYSKTTYKKQIKQAKARYSHHKQSKNAVRANEARRRAQHERTVASLRQAKMTDKNKSANLMPMIEDQGIVSSSSNSNSEKIIMSEQPSQNDAAPSFSSEEVFDDESSSW